MNPLLAVGQILVSIALIVAILLQARGTGLSGTFGGDFGGLSQPPRCRAPAVAVHDHPARPVRDLLPGLVRVCTTDHDRLTVGAPQRRDEPAAAQ